MSNIEFVPAKTEEIDKFYPFFEEAVKRYFSNEFMPKTIKHFFKKPFAKTVFKESFKKGGYIIFAKDGKKIVGFLIQLSKEEGGIICAEWLIVDKNYRGRDIGSTLLKLWEKECLKRGVHCIYLCTEKYNIKFYEKCGFTYMGCMPKGWFGVTDYYMYKTIQEPKEENYLK